MQKTSHYNRFKTEIKHTTFYYIIINWINILVYTNSKNIIKGAQAQYILIKFYYKVKQSKQRTEYLLPSVGADWKNYEIQNALKSFIKKPHEIAFFSAEPTSLISKADNMQDSKNMMK